MDINSLIFDIVNIADITCLDINANEIWRPPRKSGLTFIIIEAIDLLHSVRPSP